MGNSSKPSVLVLAYYYPPQNTSGAARPSRFSKYLRELGFNVRVISSADAVDSVLVDGRPAGPGGAWVKMASGAGHVYHKVLGSYGDRMPWVPHAISAAEAAVAAGPVDVILSTSPPLSTHIAAMRLKQRLRVPWIADFRDPLAGNPFARHQKYRSFLEARIFERADTILSTTDVLCERWAQVYPQHKRKFHTIWNGFDPQDDVAPVPPQSEGPRILAHIGEIYGARNPGMILDSLSRLLQNGRISLEDIRVRLVGPLEENSSLRSHASFLQLREAGMVECNIGRVDRAEALAITAGADQLLLLDLSDVAVSMQLPAKLFDYLRVQRPVVAQTTKDSPSDRILAKSGVPNVCVYRGDSPETVDAKMLQAVALPRATGPANEWFQNTFDGRRQVDQIAALIDACVLQGAAK